ncbi:hypothetical protein CAPTEDRAFT_120239, partial [Capitella teleta]
HPHNIPSYGLTSLLIHTISHLMVLLPSSSTQYPILWSYFPPHPHNIPIYSLTSLLIHTISHLMVLLPSSSTQYPILWSYFPPHLHGSSFHYRID